MISLIEIYWLGFLIKSTGSENSNWNNQNSDWFN